MKRILTTLFALAIIVVGFSLSYKTAEAATVTLSGYAWSENIGWIKFKNASPAYGVTVDSITGIFSGQAWSETMGWISFTASDLSGCPSGTCSASLNLLNGVVSGWAKVLSTGAWMRLSGSGYSVTYNSSNSQFAGYAWGDTDLGWVHFSGSNYGVVTDTALAPPDATINVTISPVSGSWTINPGALAGSGNGSKTVTPSYSGTVYTLTPGAPPAGYESHVPPASDCTWNTGSASGSGCQMTLFGGENASFAVTYVTSFDYSLSNNAGGGISIEKGGPGFPQSNFVTVTETLAAGVSQPVSLSLSGQPSGVSYSFSSCTAPGNPTCQSTATLTVDSTAPVGTYPLTVTGSPLGKTTSFNLTITPAQTVTVTCAASPSPAVVGQTVTWTANVVPGGGTPPYTYLTWTTTPNQINPLPSGQSFSVVYSTTGTKTADVTVRDNKGVTSHCTPAGTVNIGVSPSFQEF